MESKIASFAFLDDVSNWKNDKSVETLDLIATPWAESELTGFPNLIKLRASRTEITHLKINKLPNLMAIDLSVCDHLESLEITNCPKLAALDLSFSNRLANLTGDFPSLEYLSMPSTEVATLPKMPNLKYLDLSYCSNLKKDIKPFPHLEVFTVCPDLCMSNFKLSDISSHPSLRVFDSNRAIFTFDKLSSKTHLQAVCIPVSTIYGKPPSSFAKLITVASGSRSGDMQVQSTYGDASKFHSDATYGQAALLLYGPWGIPPTDRIHNFLSPLSIEKPHFDEAAAVNAIFGAVFGSAMMDMVGLGCEFEDKATSQIRVFEPLNILWTHPRMNEHTSSYIRGTATDDTSQAVLIMRSLAHCFRDNPQGNLVFTAGKAKVDLKDFALRMVEWMKKGHIEHKDGNGLGIGLTVKRVLTNPGFIDDPIGTAKAVFAPPSTPIPSNGCVMRTAPTGCFYFWDEATVKSVTELFSRSTHCDPRCTFSSLVIAMLTSRIIQQKVGLREGLDIDGTIQEAMGLVEGIEPFVDDINKYCHAKTLEEIDLDEEGKIGYCLKAIGSAIWCLRNGKSYSESLIAIVREGGDADTNGAVVGGVIGALTGFDHLPSDLLRYMFNGNWFYNDAADLLATMGIAAPPSIWK